MMPQEVLAAKSQELHEIVDQLVSVVKDAVVNQTPIHELERNAMKLVLKAGRMAVQALVDCQGNGDVGEEYQLPDGTIVKRSEKPHRRDYVSIYGELDVLRYVYAEREGQAIKFAAVDARLALPAGKFSYLLQDWDQSFAMEEPFGQVSKTVEKILGLNQHVDSLERMNREMAEYTEAFEASLTAVPPGDEGEIFVQTADCKGVPIRRPADAPPIVNHQHHPGPKPNRKKMATVGAVYSVDRFVRTPEEVVESLFRDPQEPQEKIVRPQPCHKRMWAMLDHLDSNGEEVEGRRAIFAWIRNEMATRHANSTKPIICVMDGQKSLWNTRDALQEGVPMIDILDLLHVTPRVWEAAWLFHPKDEDAAEKFVRDRVTRILRGEVAGVIRGLRRMGTTHEELDAGKRSTLRKICAFFAKNRHRMRYNEYLASGYPIASGVIEGACRHIIKDRLERTGMNWTIPGAQAMLDLRCVHLMGKWDSFIEFRIDRETKRLYPYRDTLKTLPWSVAA